MRERFCMCEVPLIALIFLLSRCGLADAISHKQIFIKLDAAAMLRSEGATLRGRTIELHVVVCDETPSSSSTGLRGSWKIFQAMPIVLFRSCCAICASAWPRIWSYSLPLFLPLPAR